VLAGVRDRQKSDGHRHAVAMEVSSHALVQSRVEGIHFDVAVFTNLSHDHLDYHGSMEEYFEAKATLFTPSHALVGVVNADDPWGQRLLDRARIPMIAVHHGDATDIVLRAGHSEFTWRGQRITTPLTGAINVDNALLAAEAALALGELELGPAEIARAMANLGPVQGRLQSLRRQGRPERRGRARRALKRRPMPPTATVRPSRSWSTTRTPRRDWRSCSVRRGGWRPPAECSVSSAAAGTATGPSAP